MSRNSISPEKLVQLLQSGKCRIASDTRRQPRAEPDPVVATPLVESTKKRLRQSAKPVLNALETRFLAQLQKDYPGQMILPQAIRFELARNHWYKCDFFLPPTPETPTMAFEVKGPHVFRGGFENLKVAARVHSWCRFILVWEDADKKWQRQTVLP